MHGRGMPEADPRHVRPLRRPLVRAVRECWTRERGRQALWRVAFLVVLAGLLVASAVDVPYRGAIAAWVVAGSAAWIASIAAEQDRRRLIRRHGECGLPSVGGWRLVAIPAELPADDLLAIDLIAAIYDEVRVERRPIRGHPRAGSRTTYTGGGLRATARRWARSRGAPVRLGDRTLARLRTLGIVHAVRISQVDAHRLSFTTAEDALRAYERSTGRSLIQWNLPRDPRATETRPPIPHVDEPAPA